ncbi:MAG: SDR family NAD(P)-dependent oxidoreductase, partial [Dehalococcoidia bacterium]
MMDLSGKAALVTGGSRGIGRAISLRLADCGADIAVSYKQNEVAARETAQEIEGRGCRCALVQGDVALPEDAERLVESAVRSVGRIDILVT